MNKKNSQFSCVVNLIFQLPPTTFLKTILKISVSMKNVEDSDTEKQVFGLPYMKYIRIIIKFPSFGEGGDSLGRNRPPSRISVSACCSYTGCIKKGTLMEKVC